MPSTPPGYRYWLKKVQQHKSPPNSELYRRMARITLSLGAMLAWLGGLSDSATPPWVLGNLLVVVLVAGALGLIWWCKAYSLDRARQ